MNAKFHPQKRILVSKLQDELLQEGEYFEGGVSIGIALLQDRHKDADDFRADATEALREAFESGATTIIE